ncbi:hypothetical protein MJO28_008876 [Puccinia striiformis f. sp. tritici]|uniref:Tubby C-terminal domain-containing protein n=4 Tax=Puccinia striiformis TaxID=27350 RepID=A0A0L0VF59_9BASI|nr:hypothetical protein Pst134EA_015084 [Puccinia striiformis f. sp. tritici]KNE97624.1 hypothetical protein PSTG_09029 [Puccinia striiformis f. sp. tritici PST-78]POV99027.1 hypothetical protein PSTT_14047 [Puccinia striiformis]KAH9452249.1 hypothetical protein Pst134EB_016206 [Puccinia striiformis f. sp. tritici]KAH9462995.1 hypothetical protein Pst134EA_015084 [Puccinia striiformis f. sp. tritici]KAI7950055.1 hypothetical protein MJO28_008876 [Puccinia striiformis f. sp. tritici]
MRITSALTCIISLVSFPRTTHARANVLVPNDYIMSEKLDWTPGYLPVYAANGTEVFRFKKKDNTPHRAMTTTTLTDGSSKKLFELVSSNDACNYDSVFTELVDPKKGGLLKREFKFKNKGLLNDVWRFNFLDSSGNRQYYKLDRNFTNKGGRVYKVATGQPSQLVGRLRNQRRGDSWWDKSKGDETFTLSIIDGAPLPELVALLGFVLTKAMECGT